MFTLAISTSSGQFALALGENDCPVFDSSDEGGDDCRELSALLSRGLEQCNRKITAIERILVDTGPGGTSRVRTGIAFANSLSYSLDVPVCPVSSMELAGLDAYDQFKLPVVTTVKSIKGNAYTGFFDRDKPLVIEYGKIEDVLPEMLRETDRFAVVGYHREQIIRMPSMSGKTIVDSELFFGRVRLLIEKSARFLDRAVKFPHFIRPVTEETLCNAAPVTEGISCNVAPVMEDASCAASPRAERSVQEEGKPVTEESQTDKTVRR
jgi:tRNA A37 threonylcarbamoyladenosine modification protein TsaB